MGDWLTKNRGYIFVFALNFLCNLIVMGGLVLVVRWPRPSAIEIVPPSTSTPTATPSPLMVYVSGAVARPDVYALAPHSVVKNAIEAAGGATAEADLTRLNLARPLQNGEQVHVPQKGEENPPPSSASGEAAATPLPSQPPRPGSKINVNTATAAELEQLPGIGPVLAQRIVEYREANGPFQSIEDIKKVSGIGEAKFEQIKDLITV
jgi:competence protein ComEA